jgi:DNA-binding NtrC family response regulator
MNTKPRVLFVDDDTSITQTMRVALRKEPWELLTANSADEAVAVMTQSPADVVISDEKMPGTNGSDLLADLRRRWPTTIRMMLTGQATIDDAMHAVNEGDVWRFFLKPTDMVDLRQSIRQALIHAALVREGRRLLVAAEEEARIVRDLERSYPGIRIERRPSDGRLVIAQPLEPMQLADEMKRVADEHEQWRGPLAPAGR